MPNVRREINTHNPNRVIKKLKHAYWRDAALSYVMQHGPTPARTLLDVVVRKSGRPFTHKKPTVYQAVSTLRYDDRFIGVDKVWYAPSGHWRVLWEPNETHPEVKDIRRDLDEKQETN